VTNEFSRKLSGTHADALNGLIKGDEEAIAFSEAHNNNNTLEQYFSAIEQLFSVTTNQHEH